jgi:hypothetical protein
MLFRNYPGGDPDINYVWWYGEGNPVNFGGYDDPEINRLRADLASGGAATFVQALSRGGLIE